MFALTWPIELANAGFMPFQVPQIAAIFVGYGFFFAALIMTGLTLGKTGLITLLKRFLIWRVNWKWYLASFLLIPAIDFLGLILHSAFSGTPIDFSTVMAYKLFGPSINLVFFVIPFFLIDTVANGEEIGWRGYVLPRLQFKYSALLSTFILAAIWIFWHVPKFLPHWDTVYFVWWMGDTAVKALLLTWVYNNTKGSLLLVTLFHASFNTAAVFLPIGNTATGSNLNLFILIVLLEIILAIAATVISGPAHLSRSKMKQVQE